MVTSTRGPRTGASRPEPVWHVIDAEGRTLGRISSEIAVLLQGKHRPTYVSYMNTGDFVIVINAEKVHTTGKKLDQKIYYRHSGYPGGLKERTLAQVLEKAPTQVIKKAVKGMLPKNKLGRRMLSRLKLYAGSDHPHEAQVNARPKKATLETPEEVPEAVPEALPEAEEPVGAPAPAAAAEEARPRPSRGSRQPSAGQETPEAPKGEEAPKRRRQRATSKTTETVGGKATSTAAKATRARRSRATPKATESPEAEGTATPTKSPRARRSRTTPSRSDAEQGEPAEEA